MIPHRLTHPSPRSAAALASRTVPVMGTIAPVPASQSRPMMARTCSADDHTRATITLLPYAVGFTEIMGKLSIGMGRVLLTKGAIEGTAEIATFGTFLPNLSHPRGTTFVAVARGPMGAVPKRVLKPLLVMVL